jgi:hypothetical protein
VQPKDRLSSELKRRLEQPGVVRDANADLRGARQTVRGVWAFPAGPRVCLAVVVPRVGVGSACGERSRLDDGIFLIGRLKGAPGPYVAGLVGDGVDTIHVERKRGRSIVLRVLDNGFRSGSLPRDAQTLAFEGPGGPRRERLVKPDAP